MSPQIVIPNGIPTITEGVARERERSLLQQLRQAEARATRAEAEVTAVIRP